MLTLPIHNLKLVTFETIFRDHIEAKVLNDLDSYKLIINDTISIKNRYVKRLLYHHIIHELCEYILSVPSDERIVVLYSTTNQPTEHIHEYMDEVDLLTFLNKFINKVYKMLPIRILTVNANENIADILRSSSGDYTELINNAKCLCDKFDVGKFTFAKARYFSKKYGLEYLSNNYFKQIQNKQLISR